MLLLKTIAIFSTASTNIEISIKSIVYFPFIAEIDKSADLLFTNGYSAYSLRISPSFSFAISATYWGESIFALFPNWKSQPQKVGAS